MLFADAPPDSVIGIVAIVVPVGGAFVSWIITSMSANWRRAKVAEYRAIMVQNMLDKNFSPDEIERVMKATDGMPDKLAGRCDRRRRRDSEYA